MRDMSREVLARDAAWSLADGNCKGMAAEWGAWERTYLAADAIDDRARTLLAPSAICAGCPIGRPDTYRLRRPSREQSA